MSTTISGDPTTITTPLSRTISGATNATPIVITTTAAHLSVTGDTVEVSGVGGNTAAIGVWQITRISGTTFSLNGSVGSGAYTSGGTVRNISLTPQLTAPDDGDTLDAASIMVSVEAAHDRLQFLGLRSTPISTIALLKTVDTTDLAYGTTRYVTNIGSFELQDGSGPKPIADDFPWGVAPTTGPGVWRAAAPFLSTRTVMAGLGGMLEICTPTPGTVAAETRASLTGNFGHMAAAHANFFGNAFAPLQVSTTSGKSYYYRMPIDPYLVDGAVLASVTLKYNVPVAHLGLPALFPGLQVVYQEPGFASGSLGSFGYDTAASLVAYEVERTLVWTPTGTPRISKPDRSYALIIADEGSTNALVGNTFMSATFAFTGIRDARPQ